MEGVALENTRCKDPVFHFILSWKETELPTAEQADEAARIALKELDLQTCQAVWGLQSDTENRHLHVAVNRIEPKTYKAVQPSGNWTYKALSRACKKIELAQSWEADNGIYVVTADGKLAEKEREATEQPKISPSARDMEAHTAVKSAERIGQEVAAPLIRAVRSWEELHEKLAEQGMRYEKKGSGAVLFIGETPIKASQAGKDLSLSKLEKRLGEYRAAETRELPLPHRSLEPIERAAIPKVKSKWEEYQEYRTAYFRHKKEASGEMLQRHKKERDEARQSQKEERQKALSISWKGRGAELNRQRSILAAVQKAEKLNIQDQQREEREALKKVFQRRFPTFKAWLDMEENAPELFVLFRYPNNPVLFPLEEKQSLLPVMEDLRAYEARSGNKGGVAYFAAGSRRNEADFIDYGRKILLSKKYDEKSVLAAIQLASQKWGAVNITGDEKYKALCLQAARKEGIRIFIGGKEIPAMPDGQEKGKERYSTQEKQSALKQIGTAGNTELIWEKAVDEYLANPAGWNKSRPVPALPETPPVFTLIGAEKYPVAMSARHFARVIDTEYKQTLSQTKRDELHPLPPELIKQVPYALMEPIMILRDSSTRESEKKDTTFIAMLELQHKGKSLIVPFTLNRELDGTQYNVIDSIYDRDGREINRKGQLYEEWFLKQIQNQKLLYINTEKARLWADSVDKSKKNRPEAYSASLTVKANESSSYSHVTVLESLLQSDLVKNIPTEADLVKLLEKNCRRTVIMS
jgi:hypothetical protein